MTLRKILALYINEMIKISRKISVIVILGIMVAGVIGFGGLMKLQESILLSSNAHLDNNARFQMENMDRQLNSLKERLDEIGELKTKATGADLQNLEAEEKNIKMQIDMLQYAKDRDIILYSTSYRSMAVQSLFNLKETVNQLKNVPPDLLSAEQKKLLSDSEGYIARFEKVIENKDFEEYIAISNDQIQNNASISDDEKKILLESNELRLRHHLTGEVDGAANSNGIAEVLIRQIENGKRSLLDNIDYTGNSRTQKPLTAELREKIQNDIAVNTYKIEKELFNQEGTMGLSPRELAIPGMIGFGTFMLVILVMILAGGSVSQEISSGSIKSLIISPTKRWKIFTAKVASLLTVGIAGGLLLYIIAVVANGAFFGFKAGMPYVYAVNGTAKELGFYVYHFIRLFTGFIEIIAYMTFALMLSVVTRNTAASVGISIAVYFGGSIAMPFLQLFAKGEWLKFLPFSNIDFATKLFPYDTLAQAGIQASGMGSTINTSLLFSLCYVVVLIFCMGYTALDSFNRRDI